MVAASRPLGKRANTAACRVVGPAPPAPARALPGNSRSGGAHVFWNPFQTPPSCGPWQAMSSSQTTTHPPTFSALDTLAQSPAPHPAPAPGLAAPLAAASPAPRPRSCTPRATSWRPTLSSTPTSATCHTPRWGRLCRPSVTSGHAALTTAACGPPLRACHVHACQRAC